jgi:acyl carrier protein
MKNITDKVKEILISIKSDIDLNGVSNFFENGDLDSFDMVNLVSELDKAFNIKIVGRDIVPQNFMNLNQISQLIEKYLK